MSKPVRIASRGSKLALWQANYIADLLKQIHLTSEIKVIKTEGDRVQNRFLHEIGGKGVFVKELEQAMLDDQVDIAVHSLKDLPAKISESFTLAAILKRHRPMDAIIFKPEVYQRLAVSGETLSKDHFANMGPLTIATSSLRRQSLFKGLGDHIQLRPVRGNVDTRIEKLWKGDWDALILAAASLQRLQITNVDYYLIDPEWFVPCAAQGALAIECRRDHPLRDLLKSLSDPVTEACASVERKILEELGGDCTMPFGAFITSIQNFTTVRTLVLDYQGHESRSYKTYDSSILDLDRDTIVSDALQGLETMSLKKRLKAIQGEVPHLGSL